MTGLELEWQKSSFSSAGGEQCVEIAAYADTVHIRESDEPTLIARANRRTFAALITGLKAGAFHC
ncbi:DUF397 domain-containing protein [Streptomyces sp. ISL-11]|uniref:DUF397 domain-containing protein n=1 Tax=Streptomyces sp. ISL-11 TaxID=2819174 RepID=UPI001BEADB84|nr:DUF397 domain-containing protein [Streptomyces sp. ISL-11]MBT2386894.1 DUF397 domain-containing protein [Streptomyces sp. ISL-11]